jgi:hypothetical protein
LRCFFIYQHDIAAISLNGTANTGDVAEGLTTALDLQKQIILIQLHNVACIKEIFLFLFYLLFLSGKVGNN